MGVGFDKATFRNKVEQELILMQPYVQSHYGEIELVLIEEYNVFIRLKGACDTCPLSFYTITFGLEKRLQDIFGEKIRVHIQD